MFGFRYRDDLQTGQMSEDLSVDVGVCRLRLERWACSSPPSSARRLEGVAPPRCAARDMFAVEIGSCRVEVQAA